MFIIGEKGTGSSATYALYEVSLVDADVTKVGSDGLGLSISGTDYVEGMTVYEDSIYIIYSENTDSRKVAGYDISDGDGSFSDVTTVFGASTIPNLATGLVSIEDDGYLIVDATDTTDGALYEKDLTDDNDTWTKVDDFDSDDIIPTRIAVVDGNIFGAVDTSSQLYSISTEAEISEINYFGNGFTNPLALAHDSSFQINYYETNETDEDLSLIHISEPTRPY